MRNSPHIGMPHFASIAFNPLIPGHALIQPITAHIQTVQALFLPTDDLYEIALRVIQVVSLLIALPATLLLYFVAGLGLAFKYIWVYGKLSRELDLLSSKLDSIYNKLNQPNAKQLLLNLKKETSQFAKSYREVLLSFGFLPERTCYNGIVSSLVPLLHIAPRFFYWAPKQDGTVEVPADGSCLFHAAVVGLELDITHEELRANCVAWEREHLATDPSLEAYITEAISHYQESRIDQLDQEKKSLQSLNLDSSTTNGQIQKINEAIENIRKTPLTKDQYLDLVSRPSFFGATPEIYAISKMYQAKIEIRIMALTGTSALHTIGEGSRTLKLLHVRGDHFNACVQ